MKVVKIGAVWCAGCLVMKPIWRELEDEFDWLDTQYYDFDNEKDKLLEYNLDGNLPCFIFFDKNGNEIDRIQGEFPKSLLKEKLLNYKDK